MPKNCSIASLTLSRLIRRVFPADGLGGVVGCEACEGVGDAERKRVDWRLRRNEDLLRVDIVYDKTDGGRRKEKF